MKPMKPRKQSFAICVDNSGYLASLELHKVYRVVRDRDAEADGDLRVIDESGEDYLYPAEYFLPIELPQRSARTLQKTFSKAV